MKIDNADVEAGVAAGMSDAAIAEKLGVKTEAVAYKRRQLGLSAGTDGRTARIHPALRDEVELRAVLAEHSIERAAGVLGTSPSAIARAMARLGIEQPQRDALLPLPELERLLGLGLTDEQIAANVGCSSRTVAARRRGAGLPCNRKPRKAA